MHSSFGPLRVFSYICAYLLLAVPVGFAMWQGYTWFVFEARGPMNNDAPTYITIGRAMLNGIMPYTEIMENKPPGIFIISAISLYFTGTHIVGAFIEALSAFIYPLAMGYAGWALAGKERSVLYRVLLCVIGVAGGEVMAMYSLGRAGQYQTESFGALFAILYLVAAIVPKQMKIWNILVCGALLLASAGMKEPFAFTILAGMLVIYASRLDELLRRFIYPLMLAFVVGTFTMVLMGVLFGYIEHYLIWGVKLTTKGTVPSGDVNWFRNHYRYALHVIYHDLLSVWPVPLSRMTWPLPFMLGMLAIYATLRPLWAAATWWRALAGVVLVLAGYVLSVYMVAMRGTFYQHHCVFMVPLYAGLILLIVRDMAQRPVTDKRFILLLLTLVLATATLMIDRGWAHRRNNVVNNTAYVKRTQHVARYIDNVMDSCGIDRYVNVGGQDGGHPMAFTKHSPYGPVVIQTRGMLKTGHRLEQMRDSLYKTQLILTRKPVGASLYGLRPVYEHLLENAFTDKLPACARKINDFHMKKSRYILYFRKDFLPKIRGKKAVDVGEVKGVTKRK